MPVRERILPLAIAMSLFQGLCANESHKASDISKPWSNPTKQENSKQEVNLAVHKRGPKFKSERSKTLDVHGFLWYGWRLIKTGSGIENGFSELDFTSHVQCNLTAVHVCVSSNVN